MERRGKSVYIRPFTLEDAEVALDLRVRNREPFRPYFPRQSDFFFTLEGQRREIERCTSEWQSDEAYVFGIFTVDDDRLVGGVSLRNISRGAWQNATLGYYVDEASSGRGFATEGVCLALDFAFEQLGLHRVQAGTLLHNQASMRVLEKAGFGFEGTSPRYLQINGVWEDHNLFAITIEAWEERKDVHI